ncbi:fibronectin type III domain-containing protein [Flavobacterium covae]
MYLNGGETLQLSNLDLAPYFQLENLSGINQNQYSSTLPQGNYKYCIEVYDFITNQRISQKSCTFYYFVYNEPPLLNSPSNHELVGFQDPQNLIFTWTPRHLNAVNIEYEFELVELLDQQVPSNHAFLTSIPLYKTTTSTTVLHYGPVEPQLIAGRKYAWRVKALSQPGFGDKAIFNNNGYSEIFDFIYPGNCPPPKFVVAISLNATQSKITWQTNPDFVDYKIEYRKKGTNSWYPTAYYNNEAKLYDLEAGATYEYRVGGECIGGLINYTPVEEFTQPRKEEIAIKCGIKPNIDLSNTTLFEGELPNDQIILAGDFSIKLTEVRGKRSYSGKGYVNVPYLSFVKIGVEFKDITLNTDFRLVKGEIKALYDPSWKNIIDLSSLYDQIEDGFDLLSPDTEEHQFQTNFDIPDLSHITVNSNEVVVTGTNGQTQSFDLDPKELIIIRDPKGNVYAVPPGSDKPVVLNEGQAAGFIPDASNTQGITSAGMVTKLAPIAARVTFERSAESKYADDVMPAKAHPDIQKLYKTIADGATPYTLYHKGIQNEGKGSRSFDFIDAVIAVNGTTIKPESILFNIKGSVAKKIGGLVMKNGKAYQRLEVPVYHSSTPEELLALIPGKDGAKHQVLGAAKIIPIKTQTDVNITLVPVNNATIPDGIATQLNAIYADAGVQFKVTIAPNHEVAKNTLECGKDALLEKLSEDQSQFVEQYKAGKDIQKDQYYVFVTKGITPSRAISGFMPRHSQFGFVFTNQSGEEVKAGNDLATIIGHELGHGVFELQHPWEQFSTGDKNSNTPWLMDYDLGTKLAYPHWQRISHPKFGVYVLDGSEKGENAVNDKLSDTFLNKDGKSVTFVTPDAQLVSFNKNEIVEYNLVSGGVSGSQDNLSYNPDLPYGSLRKIKLKKGNTNIEYNYKANIGYVNVSNEKDVYEDKTNFDTIDGFLFLMTGESNKWWLYKLPLTRSNQLQKISKSPDSVVLLEYLNKVSPYTVGLSDKKVLLSDKIYSECLYCRSELTLKLLNGNIGKIQQIYIDKVAEIANVYPQFFDEFRKDSVWESWFENFLISPDFSQSWRSYETTNYSSAEYVKYSELKQLLENDKRKYFEKYLINLKAFIQKRKNTLNKCLENVLNNIDSDKALTDSQLECLKYATEIEYQKIDVNKAKNLFKSLVRTTLNTNDKEKIAINLFKYVKFKSNEIIEFVENEKVYFRLYNYEVPIWVLLYDKINDSSMFFSGDNRKELMKILYKNFINSERYKNELTKIIEKYGAKTPEDLTKILNDSKNGIKNYTYDYQNIFKRGWADLKKLTMTPSIGYCYNYINSSSAFLSLDSKVVKTGDLYEIEVNQVIKDGLVAEMPLGKEKLKPFDFALFKNISEQHLLSDFKTSFDANGNPLAIPVPAILMLYSSDVGSLQTQTDIIQTSLDVLSLAIPATQFTKLGRVLFYADKISSVSSMAGTAFREENPALAEFFNKTSLITGGISATDLVINLKNLIKSPINDIIKSEYLTDAGKVEKATEEYADFVLKNLSAEQLNLLSKDTRAAIVGLLEKDLSVFSKMDNFVLATKIEKAIDKINGGVFELSSEVLSKLKAKGISENEIKLFVKDITGNSEMLKLIKTDADDVIDSWLLLTERKLPICTK